MVEVLDLVRREANLWRDAILSPILGESGLQPIVCCQPARSVEGRFSGCVARFVTDCVVRLFLAGFARVRFLTFVSVL